MQPAPSPLASLAPVLAIFVIFYFLLIRPQQKRAKEQEQMLKALKKGDRVLTSGGLYGTITNLKGQELELKIAENVKVSVSRSSVAQVINPSAAETQPAQDAVPA